MTIETSVTTSTPSFFNTNTVAQYTLLGFQSIYHNFLAWVLSGTRASQEQTRADFYTAKQVALWNALALFSENTKLCDSVNALNIVNLQYAPDTMDPFLRECKRAAKILPREHISENLSTEQIATKTTAICCGMSLKFLADYVQYHPQTKKTVRRTVIEAGKQLENGGSVKEWVVTRLYPLLHFPSELSHGEIVAELYGLQLHPLDEQPRYRNHETPEPEQEQELQTYCSTLPDGAYFIQQTSPFNTNRKGHAIAYIKHQDMRFLFDPNLGTFEIPELQDANYLIASLKNLGMASMTFFNCALIP